jgi:hypothetical protein
MLSKTYSASREAPSPEHQTLPLPPPSKRRFGRKLIVAITAVVAIAVIALALLIPQGAAIIPLEVNYTVGEKMNYDVSLSLSYDFGNSVSSLSGLPSSASLNSSATIEVLDFNGQFYTLNNTQTITMLNKTSSVSYLQMINKTGYSTFGFSLGSSQSYTNLTTGMSNPVLTELLNRPEVKVGDTWEVPYPFGAANQSSLVNATGSLVMTFQGFQDLAVPAGTYRVFRVDLASKDLSIRMDLSALNASTIAEASMTMSINGQMYMEYGTLRPVKSTMQEQVSYQSSSGNYSMSMTMEMTLKQLIQP